MATLSLHSIVTLAPTRFERRPERPTAQPVPQGPVAGAGAEWWQLWVESGAWRSSWIR